MPLPAPPSAPAPLPRAVRVLVVGTGFAGLATAVALQRSGHGSPDDLLVIERAGDVGGTWRDNTYPGAACDVPTALYSFSFAPNADWPRSYAHQPEILAYLQGVARDTGLLDRVRLHCELLGARWDAAAARWRVTTSQGEVEAQVLVCGTGTLSAPRIPDLPGLDTFRGTVFHSAQWDHGHDLAGERVAVVGTGASAVQFVPEIARTAARVVVFQRTPAWVIPRGDRALTALERGLYARVPAAQRATRAALYAYRESYVIGMAHHPRLLRIARAVALAHLRRQVPDPVLRAKLTPSYTIACKRLLLSNDYLRTLASPQVELVTSAAARVTPTGLVDGDGVEHEVDTIVFGTGFTPTEPPVAQLLTGSDGRTLAATWAGSPAAHRGTTVSGFPNLFLLYGPNTNLGHSSIVYMLESQAAYVVDAVRTLVARGVAAFDVRAEAQDAWNDGLQRQLAGSVWNAGGCSSWYLDSRGRNSAMWPTFTWRFRRATRRFDVESYDAVSPGAPSAPPVSSPARSAR